MGYMFLAVRRPAIGSGIFSAGSSLQSLLVMSGAGCGTAAAARACLRASLRRRDRFHRGPAIGLTAGLTAGLAAGLTLGPAADFLRLNPGMKVTLTAAAA